MIKIQLIRHATTQGNEQKRYIGTTNEALSEAGILQVKQRYYPKPDVLYSSPMLRAVQTCKILFPNMPYQCIEELKETDFGRFENKTYLELKESKLYQDWLKSNATLPFPEGEAKEEVAGRVKIGFQRAIAQVVKHIKSEQKEQLVTFVVHGGTIMHILDLFADKKEQKDFYAWQTANGCGYEATLGYKTHEIKGELEYILCDIKAITGKEDF